MGWGLSCPSSCDLGRAGGLWPRSGLVRFVRSPFDMFLLPAWYFFPCTLFRFLCAARPASATYEPPSRPVRGDVDDRAGPAHPPFLPRRPRGKTRAGGSTQPPTAVASRLGAHGAVPPRPVSARRRRQRAPHCASRPLGARGAHGFSARRRPTGTRRLRPEGDRVPTALHISAVRTAARVAPPGTTKKE